MPIRLILLAILVALLVRFLVRLGGVVAVALRESATPPAQPPVSAVALVPCRRCGVFVPRSLAAPGADGFLCRSCAAA